MSAFAVLSVILAYFLIILVISYFTGRKADNEAFFLGNRQSPWYVVAYGMIGASLSGVTFISIPGWVGDSQFSYMQMVIGYLLGYFLIANILLPLYYKLKLTSIYTYLDERFGFWSYKTGAGLFLISRLIGASFRLYLVAGVLHLSIFGLWGIPFWITVVITILLIWLYTNRGGIKTIIWTDTLQTTFMLVAVAVTVIFISKALELDWKGLSRAIRDSEFSRIFYFTDWNDSRHFAKQFLSGAFIAVVMTGLDQDMMQKNLSCRNLREAKKNMYWLSILLIPVNILFLSLGALLYIFAARMGVAVPERTDDLFPLIATQGYLWPIVTVFFIIGLVAAAYSSADSALTSLTTSFTVDILNPKDKSENHLAASRKKVHVLISVLLLLFILLFRLINDQSVISAVFTAAGYTYGPLLGLYGFGLFTKYKVKDKWVPLIAVLSPAVCYIISTHSEQWFKGYEMGFELLILNGFLTFVGLFIIRTIPQSITK